MRSLFRIGKRKLAGLLFGVVVAGGGYLAWSAFGLEGLMVATLVTVLFGLGAVGFMVASAERRIRGEIGYFAYSTRDLINELWRDSPRPGEHDEALLRALNASYRRLELELVDEMRDLLLQTTTSEDALQQASKEALQQASKRVTAELDALLQVHQLANLAGQLPLMGGFALAPRGMLQAVRLASRPGLKLIVECGSGTSTFYMARALEQSGVGGRLVALEHLPEYAEQTRSALREHGLEHIAEVRLAPLEEVTFNGEAFMWYSHSAIEDLDEIGLLLVDGPPKSSGSMTRYPALPLLGGRLSNGAVILVDDVQRRDEGVMIARWLEEGDLSQRPSIDPDQTILEVR